MFLVALVPTETGPEGIDADKLEWEKVHGGSARGAALNYADDYLDGGEWYESAMKLSVLVRDESQGVSQAKEFKLDVERVYQWSAEGPV